MCSSRVMCCCAASGEVDTFPQTSVVSVKLKSKGDRFTAISFIEKLVTAN